jgi:hypothetical protein
MNERKCDENSSPPHVKRFITKTSEKKKREERNYKKTLLLK